MEQKKTNEIFNAMTLFANANSAMIDAITNVFCNICKKKDIVFDDEIDVATSNPLFTLVYDKDEDVVYATDEDETEWELDDLTGNELFEICKALDGHNWKYVK